MSREDESFSVSIWLRSPTPKLGGNVIRAYFAQNSKREVQIDVVCAR